MHYVSVTFSSNTVSDNRHASHCLWNQIPILLIQNIHAPLSDYGPDLQRILGATCVKWGLKSNLRQT